MKLKSAVAAAVISTVLMVSASGCDISNLTTEGALRPPKTMGDEAEIEQLIAETSGNNYTLKYPKNGNHRSAITMVDLDGNNIEEAIAFYQNKSNTTALHMVVMYNSDDEWKLAEDFTAETTDIDRLDFADVNGNGTLEILAGYSTYSPNVNFLSAYSYNQGEAKAVDANLGYSSFYCGDINSDGKTEVLTLSLYSTEVEAKATMLEYDNEKNRLYEKSTVEMDPNITGYKNVTFCDISKNTKCILVDGTLANDDINTQIIYFNKEHFILRNPMYRDKTKNVTQRSINIMCSDIDRDNSFEIPIVSSLPIADTMSAETSANKIIWNRFDVSNESLVPSVFMAANYTYKYTIKMPESWTENTVTATMSNHNSIMTFYEWKGKTVGEKLFEIRVFDVTDWDKGTYNDTYNLIYKDNKYAYTFINSKPDSQFSMTDDQIKTAFAILNEIDS